MSGTARCCARTLAAVCGLLFTLASFGPVHAQTLRFQAFSAAIDASSNEPFGLAAYAAPSGPLWVKWRGLEDGLAADKLAIAQCRIDPGSCSPAVSRLLALVEEARGLGGRQRLGIVNRAVNLAIRYTSDVVQHGVADFWSPPLATFASLQGDCEDYAIAKFTVLREAGVAVEDLRLLLAHNRVANEAHAVLAARLDGRWLILDNRRMALIDDEHSAELMPLFALDDDGVRQFGAPSATRLASAAKPDVMPAMAARGELSLAGAGGLPLVI